MGESQDKISTADDISNWEMGKDMNPRGYDCGARYIK
jgi:hypothetical protein